MRPRVDISKAFYRHALGVILIALALVAHGDLTPQGDGITIDELREFAATKPQVEFRHVRNNPSVAGERREVVSFQVDGLHQYALILWPAGEKPEKDWPVLLFNHGYHPNPPNYGRIANGQNSRPGDYYRGVAQVFAEHGYVVVAPDYRGHNDSEGAEYTTRALADHWYTRDAIAAYYGLASLTDIDHKRVYMIGHSMGGPITQRALLVLRDKIQAASVWSGSGERPLGYVMAREMKDSGGNDSLDVAKPGLDKLERELAQLGPDLSLEDLSARKHIDELKVPLSIHHSRGDGSIGATGSMELAARLYMAGREYQLFIYDSDDHLFSGSEFEQAVEHDLAWFRAHSK
jgi:dipeptidyl aminopeptidase/acylaminoacyl peptidase